MSASINLTRNFLFARIANAQPANAQQAEQLGIKSNISEQLAEKFVPVINAVNRYDNAAGDPYSYNPRGKDEEVSEASFSAGQAMEAVASRKYEMTQDRIEYAKKALVEAMLDKIDTYKNKCYSGDATCLKSLVDLSDGKIDSFGSTIYDGIDFSEVFDKAGKAIESLVKDSPDYPELLNLIIKSQLLSSSKYNELEDAPAHLMNKAAHSETAMQLFKKLLNSGVIRLEEFAEKAVDLDPTSAIVTLLKLAGGNTQKDQKLTIIGVLSKFAKERSGSMAGGLAAKGLEKIIKKESNQGVLKAAFDGLKNAAMAGNKQAMKSLENLAKDPTISFNKAVMAIKCLTAIAKSGSAAGSDATDALVSIVNDKKVSPAIRMKTVEGLTEVAKSGNANGAKATDALVKLAKNPNDQIGQAALNSVLKLNEQGMINQDQDLPVAHLAAKNNRLDPKVRQNAFNQLETAFDNQVSNHGEAFEFIKDLAQAPQNNIGFRAKQKLNYIQYFQPGIFNSNDKSNLSQQRVFRSQEENKSFQQA